jgi:hypothetical protein
LPGGLLRHVSGGSCESDAPTGADTFAKLLKRTDIGPVGNLSILAVKFYQSLGMVRGSEL